MRVAILSDIHGNLTAFDAVLADLRDASPDGVLHGGDVADGGSSPAEIVDVIRDLGWPGVMGNGDEMLYRPASLEAFAGQSSAPASLWTVVREMADFTRCVLGSERLVWLSQLPLELAQPGVGLVHATPQSCWKAPPATVSDEDLSLIYGRLQTPVVVFGHTHRPAVRELRGMPRWLINSGSVGLPYDGDPRASYLLLDEGRASIRRVEYDIDEEIRRLAASGLPHADWTARMLRSGLPSPA